MNFKVSTDSWTYNLRLILSIVCDNERSRFPALCGYYDGDTYNPASHNVVEFWHPEFIPWINFLWRLVLLIVFKTFFSLPFTFIMLIISLVFLNWMCSKNLVNKQQDYLPLVFCPRGKELKCQFLLLAIKSYSDEWVLRAFNMKEIICFEMIVYVIFKRN